MMSSNSSSGLKAGPHPYKLPNDLPESQRLNLQHRIWTRLIGDLYPADLQGAVERRLKLMPSPEVLDVGCGTGIWAIEMCKRFSGARVTGLDLTDWNVGNPILPRNYTFTKCDLSHGLPVEFTGRFDVIQCRAVLQHVNEPQNLIEHMARCLKPGGILLLADGELSQGSFDRLKQRVKPFVYDQSISPERNLRRGDANVDVSWFAGWLRAFGQGLESPDYQQLDKMAKGSRHLTEVTLRDLWMDVSWSEDVVLSSMDQDVKELICINYLKAFDAVRSVLVRQGIPESFVRGAWQPRIMHELRTREFTSLWHYASAVRDTTPTAL